MSTGAELGAAHRLGRNFTLGEFSGWMQASRAQVENLRELVATVLQPIRDPFGPVLPTSWIRWSSGAPRTGAHSTGGAADFIVPGVPSAVVFWWAYTQQLPVGEFIDERDHLHATLPGIGGRGEWLIEPTEGEYVTPGAVTPGDPWRPPSGWYELPGIDVTVPRFPVWMGWAALVALLLLVGDSSKRGRVA